MLDFAALSAAALGRSLAPTERFAIAVSGGPDSVALMLLADAAFPGRVAAVTVDHGLRAGAAVEAATVAAHCTAQGIPHAILHWTGDKPAANIQAAAREARYALMADWCAANGIAVLLTAHHADDQAETMLMRLARGSGGSGLAGIRTRRDLGHGVTLVRPLLGVRRAALGAIVAASDWSIADDPSNRDPRYRRTHARRLLAANAWLEAPRIAEAAAHLEQVEAALEWTVDLAWAGRVTVTGKGVDLDASGLPAELVRRLVRRAIAAIAPSATPRGPDITRLITRLEAGQAATIAGVRAYGRGTGNTSWHFSPAPSRRELQPK